MTRYLSRIGGSGAGAGIRPRVRSLFEPAPRAPIDGLSPAMWIPAPQPDSDLDTPAWEQDRSRPVIDQLRPAAVAPGLDAQLPRGGRGPDRPGPGTAPSDATVTAPQLAAAALPLPPRRPTDPEIPQRPPPQHAQSPPQHAQSPPQHAQSPPGRTDGGPATPAGRGAAVSRSGAGTRADPPSPSPPKPEAHSADPDANAQRRRAEPTAPMPAARSARAASEERGSESAREQQTGGDRAGDDVTPRAIRIPTATRASRDDLPPAGVAVPPVPAWARPGASLAAQVPLPPPPGGDVATAPTHVSVSIGRVEVRAPAASAAPAPEPSPRGPRRRPQSLDEYMRTRTDRRIG